MNRIVCVSGLRQEGKTTEIVNEFKGLSSELTFGNDEIMFKPHFIICVFSGLDIDQTVYLEKFKKQYNITNDGLKIGSKIIMVDNEKDLLKELTVMVKTSDCKVFIDDLDTIIEKTDFNGVPTCSTMHSSVIIEEFVDKYPNKECSNSIDITYTRTRFTK